MGEEIELPPLAAVCRSFELGFDLNRPSQPRLSDLAGEMQEPAVRIGGRSDKRA